LLPSFWREARVHRHVNKDGVHFAQCVVFAYCLVMTKVQSRNGQRRSLLCLFPIVLEV
jgi:hypothetical protein